MTENNDEPTSVYVISSIDTTDGPVAAVYAAHRIIAERVIKLFETLEKALDPSYEEFGILGEIEYAYQAYKDSPQAIVDAEAGIVEAEVMD